MRSTSKPKKKKQKNQGLHPEAKALFYTGGALFLFLSLFSFVSAHPEQNWLGISGHFTALVFLYLLGLSSFFIPLFLLRVARNYFSKNLSFSVKREGLFFLWCLLSISLLLNQIAEHFPEKAAYFQNKIYTESFVTFSKEPKMQIRYNLGGIPLYYWYKDLSFFSLKVLLSDVGCLLLGLFSALMSFFFITKIPLAKPIKALWQYLIKERTIPKSATSLQKPRFAFLKRLFIKMASFFSKKKTPYAPVAPIIKTSSFERKLPPLPKPKEKPKKPESLSNEVKIHTIEPFAPSTLDIKQKPVGKYELPSPEFISDPKPIDHPTLKKDLTRQASVLEETLKNFGIEAKVVEINCGPSITSFEVQPPIGVKVQKIKALENDIALNMEAKSIRILAPIPGKAVVGVEVPAASPQEVSFKEMLLHYQQKSKKMQIPILLGKTVNGDSVISDLAKMPHCLIAGATGSGKSVCVNTIIMSLLMTASPEQLKFLMIDPKKVELTQYSNLPHMIAPVISEAHGAYAALQWLVREMQKRYDILKHLGLRNITSFNSRKIKEEIESSYPTEIPERLPLIVAIIDEFADLMMVSSSDLETPIARIAQMARAVGIHLILATQRPSREVITGIIKANFPTRIAFKVSSRINSQIILDETGAESLLGNGDLLLLPPGSSNLVRAQGAYISDEDINKVVDWICAKAPPNYLISSFDKMAKEEKDASEPLGKDSLYEKALEVVVSSKNASTTFLQRKLKVGYARAASLIDELEENGVIGKADGSRPRQVLLSSDALYDRDSF